jgi:hypothetical protein
MDRKERERLLNMFADKQCSDEQTFTLARAEKDGLTFTESALEEFKEVVFMFIGGRIWAFMDRTGKPAQKLKVTIKVEVDSNQ